MAKHNGKCEQCGKSLRVSVEQFIGPAKSKPIAPGETMPGGTMTCIKQLSGTSWCADFRVGNWAIVEGRKICTTCAEAKLDPNNHPAAIAPTRYAFNLDCAGPGVVILTLDDIRAWRATESEYGRPAGLADFWKAHNICPTCKGNQRVIVGYYGNRPVIDTCPACNGSGLDRPARTL